MISPFNGGFIKSYLILSKLHGELMTTVICSRYILLIQFDFCQSLRQMYILLCLLVPYYSIDINVCMYTFIASIF